MVFDVPEEVRTRSRQDRIRWYAVEKGRRLSGWRFLDDLMCHGEFDERWSIAHIRERLARVRREIENAEKNRGGAA